MQHVDLHGKVAIVTGANREIGAALAEALANAGAAVLVAHYGEADRAAAVTEHIRAAGGQAATHEADLRSVTATQQMITRAVELWGRLDILAANAGLTLNASFLDTDEQGWDSMVDLNLKGSFFGAQAAARQMIAQGNGGRIVFSSSVTGVQAVPGLAAYGVTKAALLHMARTLGVELGSYGVTVNALGIGATLNERNLHTDPAYAAHWRGVIPTGRVGQPSDVAAALLFLVSPAASMVNGHTVMIDGGWTARSVVPQA
jgi:3-oxoacyl-[acyl-carrier protein] reductase